MSSAAVLPSNLLQPRALTQPATLAASPAHFFHPGRWENPPSGEHKTPGVGGRPGFPGQGVSREEGPSFADTCRHKLSRWMRALGSTSQAQQLSPALNASWREKSGAVFFSDARVKAQAVDSNWMCWMPTQDRSCESATSLSRHTTLRLKWWIYWEVWR